MHGQGRDVDIFEVCFRESEGILPAEVQAELISEAARTDLMHCKALDDWCVANDVHQELVAAADVLQEGYAATWQASMR